jgi:TonB family protein
MFGWRLDVASGAHWGRAACGLGTSAAGHPRGLTSNRHAGRPDRWSIRAFALLQRLRTTSGCALGDRRKPKFDPRSPVQPAASAVPYFVFAAVAAVLVWALQQNWLSSSIGQRDAPQSSAMPDAQRPRGDVRSVFTADDYPASAQRNGEEGTAQAQLTVGADGRVTRCVIVRSSGSTSLDSATCSVIEKRARFTPALDRSGNPISSTVVTPPVTWRLEG